MSVQAMSWVIENSKHKGSAFVVLLMIANHAHADGTTAYPSIDTIAREARISPRQVYNVIVKLERSKELLIFRNAGPNGTNLYSIPIWQKSLALKSFQDENGVPQISPEPSGTNFKEESKSFRAATPKPETEFKTFWEQYPRKLGKQKAQHAWVKNLCEGHLGEILLSLTAWRELPQWSDPQFVPYPATWLNEKRFNEIPAREEATNGARQAATGGATRAEQRITEADRQSERVFGRSSGLVGSLRPDLQRRPDRTASGSLPGNTEEPAGKNPARSLPASAARITAVPADTRASVRDRGGITGEEPTGKPTEVLG